MKIKGLSVLLAAMLWAAAAFAGDDAINGTWAGPASTDRGGNFFIFMHIQDETAGTSVMAWGGGQCSGSLSGGAQGNNTYVYRLTITDGRTTPEGTDGCVDGTASLVFDGVKTLQYTWNGTGPAGQTMSATAVLEKKGR